MLKQIIQQLEGFAKYKTRFEALSKEFSKIQHSFYDEELSLYFKRLIKPIQMLSAENAYKLLSYLFAVENHFQPAPEDKDVTGHSLLSTYRLLDECVISLKPFICIVGDIKGVEDEAIITLLHDDIIRHPYAEVVPQDELYSPEKAEDSLYLVILKRLVAENVYLDSNGNVFRQAPVLDENGFLLRKKTGETSIYADPNNKLVSLGNPNAFHSKLLCSYIDITQKFYMHIDQFIQLDGQFFEKDIVDSIATLPREWLFTESGVNALNGLGAANFKKLYAQPDGELKQLMGGNLDVALQQIQSLYLYRNIHKKYLKKYQSLLQNLPREFILANPDQLNELLADDQIIFGLVRNEVLLSAFHKLDNPKQKQIFTVERIAASLMRLRQQNLAPGEIETVWNIIIHPTLGIPASIILEFYKKLLSNNLLLFEAYIHLQVQAHKGSQLLWLNSLHLKDSNKILQIMEKFKLKIDYVLLFNGSVKLRRTEVLMNYAQRENLMSENQQQPLSESTDQKTETVVTEDFATEVAAIHNKTYLNDTIQDAALEVLEGYAKKYLQKRNDQYYGKQLVPNERALAFSDLKKALTYSDPGWVEFNRLYNGDYFRRTAGYVANKGWIDTLIGNYSLWTIVEEIHAKIIAQQAFFEAFKNPKLLTKVISDDVLYSAITTPAMFEVAYIYEYCNRAIFLDLLVQYQRVETLSPFKTIQEDPAKSVLIHSKMIMSLTSPKEELLDKTNQVRHKLKIPQQKLPAGYMLPGITENVAALSADMLYQFEESDISTAEYYLISNYQSLFLNKFILCEPPAEMKSDSHANIEYFYIPVSVHPIVIDPVIKADMPLSTRQKNQMRHFEQFRALLSNLINRLNTSNVRYPSVPIVFCGLINLDGVHYIPYFIHKDRYNLIHVITVDPSPQSKVWRNDLAPEQSCLKQNVHHKLERIFTAIFPGCEFSDPNVTQQLRQRDCGPNALSVLEDALRFASTHTPLISIQDAPREIGTNPAHSTQKLVIHPERLSVNFNQMRLFNYDNSLYYYAPLAMQSGMKNRAKWADRLRQFDSARTFMRSEVSVSVGTQFEALAIDEYNYQHNIEKQTNADQMSSIFSDVASTIFQLVSDGLITHDIDDIKRNFINSLHLPTTEKMNQYAILIQQRYPAIYQSVVDNNDDINRIIAAVFESNIKDAYKDAVINAFNTFAKTYKMGSAYEDHTRMVHVFVNNSPAAPYYMKLSEADKQAVLHNVDPKCKALYTTKLTMFHDNILDAFFETDFEAVLLSDLWMTNIISMEAVYANLIKFLKKYGEIGPSITFFDTLELKQTKIIDRLHTVLTKIVAPYSAATLEYLKAVISEQESLTNLPKPVVTDPGLLLSTRFMALLPVGNEQSVHVLKKDQFLVDTFNRQFSIFAALIAIDINEVLLHACQTQYEKLLQHYVLNTFNNRNARAPLTIIEYCDILAYPNNLVKVINHLAQPHLPTIGAVEMLKSEISTLVLEKTQGVHEIILNKFHLVNYPFDQINEDITQQDALQVVQDIIQLLLKTNADTEILTDAEFDSISALFPIDGKHSSIIDFYNNTYSKILFMHLQKRTLALSRFNNAIGICKSLLVKIRDQLKIFAHQSNLSIDPAVELAIFKSIDSIDTCSKLAKLCNKKSLNDTDSVLQQFSATAENEMKDLYALLKKHYYVSGETNFAGITSSLRLLLVQFFNVELPVMRDRDSKIFPMYVSPKTAVALDAHLDRRMDVLSLTRLDSTEIDIVFPPRMLGEKNIPKTYGSYVTPRSLYQIIFNWEKFSITGASIAPSPVLQNLQAAMESTFCRNLEGHGDDAKQQIRISMDEALDADWCEQYLKPLLQYNESDEITLQFVDALNLFANFHKCTQQPDAANAESEVIGLPHLNQVMTLFVSARKANNLKRYLEQLQAPAALNCTTDLVGSYLQAPTRLFFLAPIKTPGLLAFEQLVVRITRQHAHRPTPLDRGDIEALKELLAQRWKEIPKNSYSDFNDPTDRIYLLLALLLKQALKNVGTEISAYELLMPGVVNRGILPPVAEQKEDEMVIEMDIDSYNYKDILVLQDGSWLSLTHFIYEYKRSKLLLDPFTKTPLTPAAVQYILETREDAKEQLLFYFRAYYCNVLKMPGLRDAFLKFLQVGLVADNGYSSSQIAAYQSAQLELMNFIYKLPEDTQRALMELKAPGQLETLGEILGEKKSGHGNCAAYVCLGVAKILWHHCPEIQFKDFGPEFAMLRDTDRENIKFTPRLPESDLFIRVPTSFNEGPLSDIVRRDSPQLERGSQSLRMGIS
jgi:hypothetical protein